MGKQYEFLASNGGVDDLGCGTKAVEGKVACTSVENGHRMWCL